MGKIFFTADCHFGNERVMRLDERPFATCAEQDEVMIQRWCEKVGENDSVYILGDFSDYSAEKTAALLDRLSGKKYLIRGNHDKCAGGRLERRFVAICDYMEICEKGRHLVLSHYPLAHWKNQRYGWWHLYGHLHRGGDAALFERYRALCVEAGIAFRAYNVGCMYHDYAPVTLEELWETGGEHADG